MDVETKHRIAQSRVDALKAQIPAVLQAALKYRRTVWVVGDIDDGELTRWRETDREHDRRRHRSGADP